MSRPARSDPFPCYLFSLLPSFVCPNSADSSQEAGAVEAFPGQVAVVHLPVGGEVPGGPGQAGEAAEEEDEAEPELRRRAGRPQQPPLAQGLLAGHLQEALQGGRRRRPLLPRGEAAGLPRRPQASHGPPQIQQLLLPDPALRLKHAHH